MPWREAVSGTARDYALAGTLIPGSGVLLFFEQTAPILAWCAGLLGVIIGVQRVYINWKHPRSK